MLTAPAFDIPGSSSRRARAAPLALSAVVHLALLAAWAGFPVPEPAPEERALTVEIAAAPPVPRTEPPPAPREPRPEPEVRQIPQLQEGELAARSSPVIPPRPATAPPLPKAEVAPPARKPAAVTQNERDLVLSQVLRHWKPPRELAAYDNADIFVAVTVGADGYFAEAYDARRPWTPDAVFDGYGRLHPQDIQRRTVDAFYRAIRQAQPVRLPPTLKAKAPFTVRLAFRFRDARN